MASPTKLSLKALKRLGRYLQGRPRLVYSYPYQAAEELNAYSDTDWAGCARTRKSTSGGCLMLGTHLLKSWSSTQATVALSSGEAEFYGVVRAASTALGQQALFRDLGLETKVKVWTDSSAAIGICSRQGLGRLRHVEANTLWVQEKVRSRAMELLKVRGEVNPADLFTKHLSSADRVDQLVRLFGCAFRGGRPEAAPQLRRDPKPKVPDNELTIVDGRLYRTYDDRHADYDLLSTIYNVTTQSGRSFIVTPEAQLHDQRCLPHLYPASERSKLFPKVEVPREEFLADWNPPAGGKTWVDYEGCKAAGFSDGASELRPPCDVQPRELRHRSDVRGGAPLAEALDERGARRDLDAGKAAAGASAGHAARGGRRPGSAERTVDRDRRQAREVAGAREAAAALPEAGEVALNSVNRGRAGARTSWVFNPEDSFILGINFYGSCHVDSFSQEDPVSTSEVCCATTGHCLQCEGEGHDDDEVNDSELKRCLDVGRQGDVSIGPSDQSRDSASETFGINCFCHEPIRGSGHFHDEIFGSLVDGFYHQEFCNALVRETCRGSSSRQGHAFEPPLVEQRLVGRDATRRGGVRRSVGFVGVGHVSVGHPRSRKTIEHHLRVAQVLSDLS